MTGSEQTRLSRLFEHVPKAASAAAIFVGILVLFGWLFGIAPLRSAFSGLVAMKANTALGFILAGASLWTAGARRRLPRIVSRSCAGVVLLLGLLVLAEYLSGADFGIDQLLARDITTLPGDIPGRMAVSTAFCFAALGGALVLLSREKGGSVLAVHALATVPILVAGAALVSYGYDLEAFLRIKLNYTPMALHTAAVFVMLGLGIVSARPDFPFRRTLTSDSAAGSTARRLLPAAIGLQLVMGWLLLKGHQAGYLSEAVSLALFAVANIGGLGALIQWNAVRLDQADAQRRLAEGALRKSAEEIEDLYNRAPIGYHSVDKDGTLVRINDTELAWLGYTREEVVGRMNFADLLTPESLKTFRETFAESKAHGWAHGLEYDLIRKDGTILPVLLNATAVRDAQGNFVMSRSTIYDITERKQNEAVNAVRLHLVQFALTHSLDELLEETLNQTEKLTGSLIGFYHFVEEDQNSLTLQTWSTRTKAEFCKATGQGLHYPIAEAGVWADCVRQGKPVIHNDYAALPNRKGMPEGHAQVIREVVVPVRRGQKLSAILGVGNKPTDYTEKDVETLLMIADLTGEIAARKRAEEALRAASSYTRSLIEASLDPLVTISAEGKVTDVNDATIRATGVSREELIGSDFSNYFTEPDKARAGYQEVFARGFVTDYPLALRHASGSVMEVLYNASVYRNEKGEVQGVFAAARDITERKQAEDALKHASAYTRSLIEASLDPLVTISAEGKVTDVNDATIRATGVSREELIGSDFSNYFTEPDKARAGYQEVFAKGFVTDYPLALRHASGGVMEVLYNASIYRNEKGEVAGVFAAARDVTRARRAEKLVRERVKELQAFFHLSELAARKDFPLDSLCQQLANVLPGSWQYPETACARIVIDESEFRTANFGISEWMQAAPVKVLGEVVGKVEVGYLEQKPEEDEGPFLKEERQLIEAIAERVGQIAELKRAEESIRISQARFSTIFNQAPLGIALIDSVTGRIYEVNPRFAEIAGRTVEEMMTIDWMSITHPDDVQADLDNMVLLNAGKIPGFNMDKRYIRPDGSVVWINMTIAPLRREPNISPRHLCMIDDITERKRIAEELAESEALFRNYFELGQVGMAITSLDQKWLQVNRRLCELLEYTREELVNMTWTELTYPDDLEPDLAQFRKLLSGEIEWYSMEKRFFRKGGGIAYTYLTVSCQRKPDRTVNYVIASVQDITERKQAEDALKQASAYTRSLIEASLDPLVTISAEGKIMDVNQATEKLTGFPRERLIGSDFSDYFTEPEKARQGYQQVLAEGFVTDYPLALRNVFGRVTEVLYNATVFRNEAGEVQGVFAAARDITERKRAEEALKQALAELRELNENLERRVDQAVRKNLEQERMMVHQSRQAAMGEMIGNIAHQWRQPLNALNMVLANIKDAYAFNELTPEEMEQYVARGKRLTQKMSDTIDDFRNFFRPAKEKVPFSLKQALEDTLDLLGASLKIHDIEVTVEGEMEVMAYGFPNEYSQVLVNILNNAKDVIAAQKIAKGEIRVRIAQEGGIAVMAIRDNGGGIPEGVLPRMFEAYFTTKEQGTGIGLYMSKLIIENNMGGQLLVRNVAGGAEFTIVCPLAPKTDAAT